MSALRMATLVEGDGDVLAVPKLIHRVAKDIGLTGALIVQPVIPAPVSRLRKNGSLETEIENLARKLGGRGGILILLDCDWDNGCPKKDGPAWLRRARAARPDMPIHLVLAHKEYESWFLAAASSLRGICGLPQTLESPDRPDEIRGAKEWLSRHMPHHTPYSPVPDQATLTSAFDMSLARRRSDSFDKCYREIVALLTALEAKVS